MTNAPIRPGQRLLNGVTLAQLLADWWEELMWPRVLGAARLGLRPGRLGLAFFAVVLAWVLLGAGLWADGLVTKVHYPWPWEWMDLRQQMLVWPWRVFVSLPKAVLMNHPVSAVVLGPVLLAAWGCLLGAVSRMTACEMSLGQTISWTDGLVFSVQRWRSVVGGVLGPLVLIWLIALALGLGGWVLMRWPILNIAGGLMYGAALLAGAAATLLILGYVLAHHLIVPAVMCEGTDAIDAVQRAYTYFFAKPVRLIAYTLVGLVGFLAVIGVCVVVASWTIGFAAYGSAAWAGQRGNPMVWKPTLEAAVSLPMSAKAPAAEGAVEGTYAVGAWLIRLWTVTLVVLVWSAVVSCWMSVSTAVYLAMRRVCDGQDIAELWMPGMVPGAMAQVLEGRSATIAAMGISAGSGPAGEEADYQ